jgi:hypothetical protein
MKKTLLLLCIVVFTSNLRANDSQYLISEMEALRDSLKIEDPARIDLTLRLADLYFDVSIQEGKGEDQDALKKNRLKAFELYKQSLNGTDSLKKATGLNKIKIQFQMARLLSRLDEGKMAESYYLDIIANNESPKKMVEQSALALAEWHEDEAKYPEAKKYYDKAVANCSDRNSCNYANYRLGWLYYKDTKLDDAIVTMEKSLWTDDTTIRENSLTDLLLFVSNKDKTDGTRELEMIRKIATKAKRPELVRQLVEAFYVAGNRFAGSNLLAELNKEDPNVYYEVRLLEEFYGFRKWDKVQQYLSIIEKRKPADLPKKAEEAKEVQTILRRFIVQVDAEMQVVADLKSVLKRSIDSYLSLYPKDEMRTKMQAGWLAVVEDKNEKMAKLDSWIKEDIALKIDPLETRKLRQARLSMAQETKNSKIIIEDAIGIAEILKGTKEADEFYYVGAREQYVSKNPTSALLNFKTVLANSKSRKEITNWTILSQNLILDIFNSQKNYDGIVTQVGFWKDLVASVPMTEEITKETKSMDQILVQAQFEKAFTLKDTKLALDSFYNFCMTGQYPEKSCPNAKVLSVKFKDQEKLVNVLEKMDDKESLAVELELMGRFSDAASVREKFELSTPIAQNYLNIAFLYELDQNLNERDRVLAKMVDVFKTEKKLPAEIEKATFVALDEANLIDEKTLLMPWSPGMKIKIASRLEVENPSAEAKKALLSVNEGHGAVWAKVVLSKLEEDFNSTNKIKFYGAQSKKLFKQRTASLDKFASTAKPMLDSADLETRVYILHMLKMAYKNIANEILNTPIPDGLDAETLNQVTTQISTMADPFDRVNEDYDRLINEQLAAMTDVLVKEKVSKNLTGAVANYANFIEYSGNEKGEKYTAVKMDHNPANLMRKKLLAEPEDKKTLIGLKEYYTLNKNPRFAAYYASRVENLKQVE